MTIKDSYISGRDKTDLEIKLLAADATYDADRVLKSMECPPPEVLNKPDYWDIKKDYESITLPKPIVEKVAYCLGRFVEYFR